MTDRELRIWDAAYGAAMAQGVYRELALFHDSDRAISINAEWAIAVADLAVHQLRQWVATEDSRAGQEVTDNYLPSR